VNLHGPVWAAESAATGSAEVTISFDAWAEGAVAPSMHRVEVVRPKVVVKHEPVSRRLIRSLVHPHRKAEISMLQFSADGRRLIASGYPSGVIQTWDAASGKELSRVETPPGYRGTDDYAALTADWRTAFIPREGGNLVRTEVDGEKRYRTDYAGEVQVWDVGTGRIRPSIKLAPGRGTSQAVVSRDGTKLITVELRSYDRSQPQSASLVYRDLVGDGPPVELATGFATVAFSPDSRAFVLASGSDEKGLGKLRLFDASTGYQTAVLADDPKSQIYGPVYSPDGKRIAAGVMEVAGKASVVKLWDTVSGKELIVLKPPERSAVYSPAFSPDGRFVTTITGDWAGCVWDAATGGVVLKHGFGEKGYSHMVAISPDGRLAAVAGRLKSDSERSGDEPDPADVPQPLVALYDLAAAKHLETLACPPGYVGRAAFSPDGKTLAVGTCGVHLFDIADLARSK
jgi:WD40 repeat protein